MRGHSRRLPWIAAVAVTVLLGQSAARATIQFESATYSVSEGAGTLTIHLTRTGDLSSPRYYSIGLLPSGTATNTHDFSSMQLTDQQWPTGQATVDYTITILNDSLDEPDETIGFYVSVNAFTGTPDQTTVTILDDDAAQPTPPLPNPCNTENCIIRFILKCPAQPQPLLSATRDRLESASRLVAGAQAIDFDIYQRLRHENLARSSGGRYFIELYDTHTREMTDIVRASPQAFAAVLKAAESWQPAFAALVAGQGGATTISAAQVADLQAAFDVMESRGSIELRLALERQETLLNISAYAGLSVNQVRERLEASVPANVTIPVATSVHGVGDSFFHSDIRVLNPSSTQSASVSARYTCANGSCGVIVQNFVLAPSQMRVFSDAVAMFFGAPESFGSIEFVGDEVLVESRIYTPSPFAPTTGMYVPGQTFDEALPEAVLTSLSHSTSLSSGFRSNIGAYNPHDVDLTATFSLYDALGSPLGAVTRTLPAGRVVQVNNVFGAAGVAGDVESAYAVVRADGVHELFAYAAVVDNQSQDLFYIRGRNNRGGYTESVTLPAVASVHGVGGTFFHSDVRVFNPSPEDSVNVTARYRCAFPSCGDADQSFELAPREMRSFDDIVAGLFGAPETFGAVEFTGEIFVDSRLYSPSRPGPTTGMAVPGLRPERALAESYLPFLSHSADASEGFRTNAGVYNGNDQALSVTFTLHDTAGGELGSVTRQVPARAAVQVNDVFGAAGIATDVAEAYALVRADGVHPLFAYAALVDNRSQDLVFTIGRGPTPSLTATGPASARTLAANESSRRLRALWLLPGLVALALGSTRAFRSRRTFPRTR